VAHTPTANPKRRTIRAHDPNRIDQPRAEHDHLVALIASRYNTQRPNALALLLADRTTPGNPTPEQIAQALPLIHAAQELRNRYLAQQLPTGQRTPPARYYIPEQIAHHHADPNTKRNPGLDLAALAHLTDDRETYLRHLPENLRNLANHYLAEIDCELTQLRHDLHENTTRRQRNVAWNPTTNQIETYRLNRAEITTLEIARALTHYTRQHAGHAKQDQRKTKQDQRNQREQDKQPHTARPEMTDELSGWLPLRIAKPPREIAHLGRFGRKRALSDTGKNPNRIANYIGDPTRRIYTRKTRGTNALVVVDCSGSMSLTHDDLDAILRASTGATVVGYSGSRRQHQDNEPNTYLLAHNQRRVRHLPDWCGGNGVDAPAVSWAIKNYRKQNAPVLWITDGKATGSGDHTSPYLSRQCRRIAQKYGAIIAPDVETALQDLAQLRAGQRPPQRLDTF
jgi:hypothetical protein